MKIARYFASSKKKDLSSKHSEAGDDRNKNERRLQLQVSKGMMRFSWKD